MNETDTIVPEALDWPWRDSSQALLASLILPDYLRLGAVSFICNADVEMRIFRAGDHVLPVVYNENINTARTAEVCSPWNHYVRYTLEEIDRQRKGLSALCAKSLLWIAIPLLRISRIDEVASVNNWLLSTNPPADLDRAAIARLTTTLCEQFPRRAIVFRTVNLETNEELARNLVASGYRLVASRTVYLLDPASRGYRQNENVRRDRKLLHDGEYQIVPHEEFSAADMPRLAELHRALYIEKYSALNSEFSPLFFETSWRNGFLEFRGLRKQGRIDAYITFFELGGLLTACLIGYDVGLPKDRGLYRRAIAMFMEESRRRGLRMHLSAGAGSFKHHRSARPCVEYDAVFDRHLPLHRRAGWSLLKAAGVFQQRKIRRGW